VPGGRGAEHILAAPAEFDAAIVWFERLSTDLVLLAEYPLSEVRAAVEEFGSKVRHHVREFGDLLEQRDSPSGPAREARSLLRADHAWFATSVEQLDWFFRIVANEDHGGHRQALGQYGRVFTESLRRHRAEERAFLNAPSTGARQRSPGLLGQR
jgi:hypothetical protein